MTVSSAAFGRRAGCADGAAVVPGTRSTIGAALEAVARDIGVSPAELELHETHLSVVAVGGDRAFKVLRPLVLPFVDHGSVDARRRSCLAGVRRNASLAPGIYRGVRAVVGAGRPRLAPDGTDGAIEHVLEMRRFAQTDTLAAHVTADAVDDADLDRLAAVLVPFHAAAHRVRRPRAAAAPAAGAALTANVDELLATLGSAADRAAISRTHRRLRRFVEDDAATFEQRAADGWVRELHGDLRAEHVVVGADRVRVVDALEFSPALWQIDVADELGFLTMDLESLGRSDLASRVLDAYVRAGGDPGPDRLRAFYGAHRALVRAKVAVLAARPGEVRHLVSVAEHLALRTLRARCVVIAGASGSGKSTLAARLSKRTGVPVLSSDLVRKALHGLAGPERAPAELYAPDVTERVYRELGRRALDHVACGRTVLVDATCTTRAARDALREGLGIAAPEALVVSCVAPAAELRRRVVRRLTEPSRTSDATPEVLERQLTAMDPPEDLAPARHLLVRTDGDPGAAADTLDAMIDAAGPRPTGTSAAAAGP